MANKLETFISVNDRFSKGILTFEKRVSSMSLRFRGLTKSFNAFKTSSTDFLFNIRNIGQSFDYIKIGVSGVVRALDKITSEGDELAKTSQRLGFTVVELQKYRYVADLAGVSSENFTKGMKKLSETSFQAQSGVGEQAKAFKSLGISVKDAGGNLKSSQDILLELASRFSAKGEAALSASEKIFAARTLLGKSGVDMITVLNQGSDAIRNQMRELEDFGIMSEEQAKQSETYRDELSRLNRGFNGLKIALASDLLKPMTESVVFLTNYLKSNKKVFTESFKPFVDQIPTLVKTFTDALPGIVNAFKKVVTLAQKFIDVCGVEIPFYIVAAGGVLVPFVATLGALVKILYNVIMPFAKLGAKLLDFVTKTKLVRSTVSRCSRSFSSFGGFVKSLVSRIRGVPGPVNSAAKSFDKLGNSAQKSMKKINSSGKSALGVVSKLGASLMALDAAGNFFEKITDEEERKKGVGRIFLDTLEEIPIFGSFMKGIENLSVDKVKFDDSGFNDISSAMNFGDLEDSELFNTTKTVNNNSHSTIDVNFNNVPKDTSITRRTFGDPSMYGFSMSPAF